MTNGQDASDISMELKCVDGTKLVVPNSQCETVLCFLGIECPLAKLYTPRLVALSKEFPQFDFVAIDSNRQDSTEEWERFCQSFKVGFPIVKDEINFIADRLKVDRNPEVIVINRMGKIVYRGRIDDQYSPGIARAEPKRHDLRVALTELAAGREVSVSSTEPEGCLIGKFRNQTKEPSVTYTRDVAPILQKNCVECHREGDIGPFAMTDYDEVVGWGDMMLETIDNGRMPPWHADPEFGQFRNERRLSNAEKTTLRKWVEEGSPLGNLKDLPAPVKFTNGWRLPQKPDLVVSMSSRPFKIPPDGTVDYQYFVVDPGFKEDKWVVAAEIIPGNRSVVHHSIVFIRPPDGRTNLGLSLLEGYVPGQRPLKFNPKRARKIPAGSKLVFQQHYTPNGTEQSDITKIGLVFVEEDQVKEELFTLAALDQEFEILPNKKDVKVVKQLPWLPRDGKILSVSPHMHYRGKSFATRSTSKANSEPETLLYVPNFDFNWQHIYEFKEPLELNKLESIEIEIKFDNSKDNPFNPNPEQYVIWGDQTWEEMAIGFFNVTRPRNPGASRDEKTEPQVTKQVEPISEADLKRGTAFAVSLFQKVDANGDRKLQLEEMPLVTRWYFDEFDANDDGLATFEEVEASAQSRYHAKNK